MNLVKLLANNWQPIAIIALVGTGLAVSHHQGYKSAFAKQQAVIDKMEKTARRPRCWNTPLSLAAMFRSWKTKIRLGATGSTVKRKLTVRRVRDDDLS